MKKITLADRMRYKFDILMSKGPGALIGALFLLSALLILVVSLLVWATNSSPEIAGGQRAGFWTLAWMSLMRTLDAGTMGGDQGNGVFLTGMFLVTMGGVFFVGSLIGILTTGLDSKLDEMRKGRSLVIEQDHTVILGWSSQIFSIISELVTANENRRSACIAILADKDKVEMEDEISSKIPALKTTRVVCRSGNPMDLAELEIVNPHLARSIIILPPESDDPDAFVIKTILALTNNPQRRPEPYHIIASIRNPRNLEVARLVARDEAKLILADDLISRITAQTCRQSGLSVVYTELLDFGGDEIYFQNEPSLAGKTFGEALSGYEDSSLIGIKFSDGRVQLNPSMDVVIQAGDQMIVIAEDDDKIHLSNIIEDRIYNSMIIPSNGSANKPERTLILGWNSRAPAIISELDQYVSPGSSVTVVSEIPEAEAELLSKYDNLTNQSVTFEQGDTTDRRILDRLQIDTFDHVILLSYSTLYEIQDADARTLITLLHLRDIAEKCAMDFSIVSEMLDVRNRELAEVTRADDFIVSDKLISLMLSQISENKDLSAVFQDLFDPDGSEVYLKPVKDYVRLGEPVNFYTLIEAARRRGEVAIGYRIKSASSDASRSYGVRVNPDKSQQVVFSEEDRLVVLAE